MMSEYNFLIEKLDQVEKISKEEWRLGCETALEDIKEGENYLFFQMKTGIKAEVEYYTNNFKELEEIVEILDDTMAINAYHNLLIALINTEEGLQNGLDLEYLMIKDVDFETKEEMTGYFTFPEGTYDELVRLKEEGNTADFEIGGYFS